MDKKTFHSIFDHFDYPMLFKGATGWLFNPAAEALRLSQGELDRLLEWGDGSWMWLVQEFYRVSFARLDDGVMISLQSDLFLSAAADIMASQLRIQLGTAFGAINILSENKSVKDSFKDNNALCQLNRALYHIFRMVTEIEQASCPGFPCRRTAVDAVELLRRLSGEVESLCKAAKVRFSLDIEPSSLVMSADPRQVEYMLLCLASNSLKCAPGSGGQVSISLRRQKDQAVFTVADNAGGFSPDMLSHPLWNDPHRLLPKRGLGLGLPLVQRIAAAHGGSVVAFPSFAGSRVVVSLPIQEPDIIPNEPRIDYTPGFSPAKILLADALPASLYYPKPGGDQE